MCKHLFCKMKTSFRLISEVNCHAKELYNIMSKTWKNILKYKTFVEHSDVILTEYFQFKPVF